MNKIEILLMISELVKSYNEANRPNIWLMTGTDFEGLCTYPSTEINKERKVGAISALTELYNKIKSNE